MLHSSVVHFDFLGRCLLLFGAIFEPSRSSSQMDTNYSWRNAGHIDGIFDIFLDREVQVIEVIEVIYEHGIL